MNTQSVALEAGLAAPEPRVHKSVPLRDLGVAPENMRFGEAPDDDIPQLADTIRAAGLLQPLTVRPGRRREKAAMALDGRRRLLALERLREAGVIDDEFLVEVFEEADPGRQAAAVLLTNTAVPVHVADVIAAIGKLLKAKLTSAAIARALGYAEVEIKRLAALSGVHAKALAALKAGKLTLGQVKLLARLPDPALQAEVAAQALQGFGFQGWRVTERLDAARVTTLDRRFALVGPQRYAAAGGRTEVDLFGELPDQLLDPEVLTELWTARARAAAAGLEADGLIVHVTGDGEADLADGLEPLGYAYANALSPVQSAAHQSAQAAFREAAQALRDADLSQEDGPERLGALLELKLAMERAGQPGRRIGAVVLWPGGRLGADSRFYAEPVTSNDAEEASISAKPSMGWSAPRSEVVDVPEPEVAVEGVGHTLHETRTDMATRGLIRALADDPGAALAALIARLFTMLALESARPVSASALALSVTAYGRAKAEPVETLDGEVRRRLAERRAAWEASGLRPIPWVAALPHGERMALLAELVAVSLDLRESRTDAIRPAARADAADIAALACADIAAYWTPDERYLAVHNKLQLLAMLQAMGSEDEGARSLKKDELVRFTAEQAAARGWAPPELNWAILQDVTADDQEGEGVQPQALVEPGSPPFEPTVAAAA